MWHDLMNRKNCDWDNPNIVVFLEMKLISKLKNTYHSAPWFMLVGLGTLRKVLLILRNYSKLHMLWSVLFSANL